MISLLILLTNLNAGRNRRVPNCPAIHKHAFRRAPASQARLTAQYNPPIQATRKLWKENHRAEPDIHLQVSTGALYL